MMVLLIPLGLGLQADIAGGAIYKYKNDRGEWCYTNDPSSIPGAQPVQESEPVEVHQKVDLGERLTRVSAVRGEIDRARNATVAIKSSMGLGSGFFITQEGHILTNKHVVSPSKEVEERLQQKEIALRNKRDELEREFDHLQRERTKVKEAEGDRAVQERDKRLEAWMKAYLTKKRAFQNEVKAFEEYKRQLRYPYDLRIFLVDNTELYVSILSMS